MTELSANNEKTEKPHIVIIDDEEVCLFGAEMLLYDMDYSLKCILGGKYGLEYLLTYPKVDLILLDLMMPEMTGLELLEIIKKDSTLKTIPIIIQTGLRTELEIEKAYALGAISTLKKPYTKSQLLKEIEKAMC